MRDNVIYISYIAGANGLGAATFILSDAISCTVSEERNGSYELALEYPINGKYAENLQKFYTIAAKPNTTQGHQLFDIYEVDSDGTNLSVKARHVFYRLAGCPSRYNPNKVTSLATYVSAIQNSYARALNGFTLTGSGSNPNAVNKLKDDKGFKSVKDRLNDALAAFGAEIKVDNFDVRLEAPSRGINRYGNASIVKHGYNIAEISYSTDTEGATNAVFPLYTGKDQFMYSPTIAKKSDALPYVYAEIRDISSDYPDGITQAQLNALQVSLSNGTSLDGTTSVEVEMVDLVRANEREQSHLQEINLCDYWRLVHEPLGIDTMMQITKLEYNVIAERYEKITLGKIDTGLAGTIATLGGSAPVSSASSGGSGLQLGESAYTAYRGDRGKAAYDHSLDSTVHVTAAQKNAWNSHITDSEIHVTQKEKDKWNAGGGGVEHINADDTMTSGDIVALDIGIYYVENPIYIEYYDDHGSANSRDMAGALSIFYDNELGEIMYSWLDYDLIVYGYEDSAEAFEYSIDNAAGGSSSGGAVLISDQTLRPSSPELTLASKTWTDVSSSTAATLNLTSGIYMIEFSAQVVGASTGYVMFRPMDGSSEIVNHRSSAPVIASTYSACNSTLMMTLSSSKKCRLSFQAYASAASHRVGTVKMLVWKVG